MWHFLKKIFFIRMSQKAANGMARSVGASNRLATLIGLAAGVRQMRRRD